MENNSQLYKPGDLVRSCSTYTTAQLEYDAPMSEDILFTTHEDEVGMIVEVKEPDTKPLFFNILYKVLFRDKIVVCVAHSIKPYLRRRMMNNINKRAENE